MDRPVKKPQLLSSFVMPCNVCKEPSNCQCPNCRTPYCSKTCQRIDWKRGHKIECKELTLEFHRGYNYVEPMAKKEAPPVVVIPDTVKINVGVQHSTNLTSKPADDSGGESCPICLEVLPQDKDTVAYQECCGNLLCYECFAKCFENSPLCTLCRSPYATNDDEFVARLRRRVLKGDAKAQLQLGAAYKSGRHGLEKDAERAVQLYELSAAQGLMTAQYNLGNCFSHGQGVKMDKKKALHFFLLAAEKGDHDAQLECGLMYANGDGTECDLEEAQRFWALAAAQGNEEAQHNLGVIQGANARG